MKIYIKRPGFSVWYLLLFALIQYPLRFEGLVSLSYVYTYLIPGLYLIYHANWTLSFFKSLIKNYSALFFSLILLIFISILWPIFTDTMDFSYIRECLFRMVLLFEKNLFLYCVFDLKIRNHGATNITFLYYFILSTCLYTISSIFILIIPHFRDYAIDHLYLTEKNRIDLLQSANFTRIGWAGWAGFDATIFCSLSVLFLCYILLSSQGKAFGTFRNTLLIVICGIGNMLFGRTGIAVSGLLMVVTLILLVGKGKPKTYLKMVLVSLFFIVILLLLKNKNALIGNWFEWALSAFKSLFETGEISDNTGSFGHLINDMYWMPSFDTLFFGDGRYIENGHYYMSTDSGIMRPILYYGAVNYLFSLIIYFYIGKKFIEKCYHDTRVSFKYISIFLLLLFTALFEFKGETYYKIACIMIPVSVMGESERGLKQND